MASKNPTRFKSAIAKSIGQQKNKNEDNQTNEGEKDEDGRLDEVFFQTFEIAVALLSTVPFRHRSNVDKWLRKFLDPTLPKLNRNVYISFLVFQMHNFLIVDPFDKEPPPTLHDLGPKNFSNQKWQTLTELGNENPELNVDKPPANFNRRYIFTPDEFFDGLPSPHNGLVAYGSVFSNHFS